MANFPSYPAATNKTDSTASATDHPNHHNILGAAVNFVNDAINAEVTRATAAEALKVSTSALGVTVPTLVGGKVPAGQLPSMVIDNTYVVASQAAMLALSANVGDIAVRTDTSANYILQTAPATTLGNWVRLFGASGAVAATSVTFTDRTGGSIAATDVNGAIIEVRDEAGGGSPNQGKPGIPPTGCLFGAQVRLKAGQTGTDVNAMAALETQFAMGRFGARRSYVTSGGNFDLTQVATRMADDADPTSGVRTSVVSLRPPTDPGTGSPHLWAYMATNPTLPGGSEGCLTHVAKQFGAYSHPIVAMVDHEMDRTVNNRGTSSEYAAFASAFFTELRTWAPRVSTLVCFGGYPLYAGSMSQGQAAAYLPSNLTLLDIIGVDPYQAAVNSTTPTAQDAVVLDFFDGASGMVAPFLTLANNNGKKPVAICEMGTSWETELSAHSREEVWGRALLYAKQNPQIKMILAFHDNVGAPGNTAHNWYLDDTPTLLNALKSKSFTAGGNTYPGLADPYFHPVVGGSGGSVASVDVDGTGGQTGNVVIPRNANNNVGSMRTIDGTTGSALPYTVTAVGDLIVGSAFGAVRMGRGSSGAVLTVDSGVGNVGGLNWTMPGTSSTAYGGNPIIIAAPGADASFRSVAPLTGGVACTGSNNTAQIETVLAGATAGRTVVFVGNFTGDYQNDPDGSSANCFLCLRPDTTYDFRRATFTLNASQTNYVSSDSTKQHFVTNRNKSGVSGVFDDNITILGGVFDGNGSNQPTLFWTHGMQFFSLGDNCHSFGCTVQNMKALDAGGGVTEAFDFDSVYGRAMNWWYCEGRTTTTGHFNVSNTGFSGNATEGGIFYGCYSHHKRFHGFTMWTSDGMSWDNCKSFANGGFGFNLEISDEARLSNCLGGGNNNYPSGSHTGADVMRMVGNSGGGFNALNSQGISLTNCQFNGNGGSGLQLNGVTRSSMVGGTLIGNTGYGLEMLGNQVVNEFALSPETVVVDNTVNAFSHTYDSTGAWWGSGGADSRVWPASGFMSVNPPVATSTGAPFRNRGCRALMFYITGASAVWLGRPGAMVNTGQTAGAFRVPVGAEIAAVGASSWKAFVDGAVFA